MKQQGISLVEIMLSLFLASLLSTVVMQQYLASKRQYIQVETLLDQAFELQLVDDLIRDSIRRAGFTPCVGISHLQSLDRRSGKTKLMALETESGKRHGLRINRMSEHFTTVLQQISPTQLLVSPDEGYEDKQSILIADCYHGEIQQILQVWKTRAGTMLILAKPLAFNYSAPVHLGEWIEEEFFMQKNRQGNLALFYQRDHAEELSTLVNNMTINLKSKQEKIVAQVIWGLEKSQNLLSETEVRAG